MRVGWKVRLAFLLTILVGIIIQTVTEADAAPYSKQLTLPSQVVCHDQANPNNTTWHICDYTFTLARGGHHWYSPHLANGLDATDAFVIFRGRYHPVDQEKFFSGEYTDCTQGGVWTLRKVHTTICIGQYRNKQRLSVGIVAHRRTQVVIQVREKPVDWWDHAIKTPISIEVER